MGLTEHDAPGNPVLASALRAYERGRLRWALAAALPLFVLPLGSWLLSGRPILMCVIGALLFTTAVLLLWRGQGWARGLGVGLAAGLIPFILGHGTRMGGHVCTGALCMSICVGASLVGGIAAGLVVTSVVRRASLSAQALAAATGVAFLTGALGCGCVGVSAVLGLATGLGATVAAARLFALLRSTRTGA
jgi:hypothetical protein